MIIRQLFGETEEGEDDLDDALKAGENGLYILDRSLYPRTAYR